MSCQGQVVLNSDATGHPLLDAAGTLKSVFFSWPPVAAGGFSWLCTLHSLKALTQASKGNLGDLLCQLRFVVSADH